MQRHYGRRPWPIQGPVIVRSGKKSRRRVKFVFYPLVRGKII